MKEKYLIDTVILIDHLNGIPAATEWLSSLQPGEATISVVTRAEVLVGTKEKERGGVELLLASYQCLSLDSPIADTAARFRQRHRWKLPDAFQAALVEEHNLKLATRNTKDFPPERFDFVFVPYRL